MRINGCLIYGVLWICLLGASTLPAQGADEVPPTDVADTELEPPLPEPLPPELPKLRDGNHRPAVSVEAFARGRGGHCHADPDRGGDERFVRDGDYGGADQPTEHTSMAEVLRNVEGLDVVRQGGPGGVTSVFIRGANSQHTKVLLDGIPMNDPSNATRGFDFSTLSVENIERIEVVRGPQSTLSVPTPSAA